MSRPLVLPEVFSGFLMVGMILLVCTGWKCGAADWQGSDSFPETFRGNHRRLQKAKKHIHCKCQIHQNHLVHLLNYIGRRCWSSSWKCRTKISNAYLASTRSIDILNTGRILNEGGLCNKEQWQWVFNYVKTILYVVCWSFIIGSMSCCVNCINSLIYLISKRGFLCYCYTQLWK